MSPDPQAAGFVRPADVVNAEIRALLIRAGGWLSAADRAVYQRLRDEWTTADRATPVRPEIVEAA